MSEAPYRIADGKMPETIMARPIMGAQPQNGDFHKSGPWSCDNPYGNAVEYIRKDLSDAAIKQARQEALRKAAEIARNACLVPPDGGSPTEQEAAVCDEAYKRIMALIDKDTD